ncbi:MAG: cyanophycinase [Bacteroidota bacterium]
MHSFRNKLVLIASLISMLSVFSSAANTSKGHLVIIGGGSRTDEIMTKFVELAGGKKATVVVFPMASTVAETVGMDQSAELKGLGVARSFYLNITRQQADNDSIVALLKDVTGIFFSGGDQVLLMNALLGSKMEARIKEIWRNGGVVGGTSAGAAVMSEVMITGEELLNKDKDASFHTLLKGNVEHKQGFGFITEAIIDQHFVVRKRHNRLLIKMLENPTLLGVAIDESTSIIVEPDRTFQVLGESVVLVYDATNAKSISTNKNGYFSARDITLNILKSGDRYDLKRKRALK